MNSTSVSRREAEVIDAIERRNLVLFGPRELERFLEVSSRNAYRILAGLLDKGLVERLARGRYVLASTYETLDNYALASHLEPASYVGFMSALHYHGLTEQVPRSIFVAVTSQRRSLDIHGQEVRFVRVKPDVFFGYDRYGDAVVSDPEKTILDCLRLPEYAGGIRQVAQAVTSDLDVDRLIRYALQLDSGAVAARLGYLLERASVPDIHDPLWPLVTSYTKLDPGGDRRNPVSEWKLYANVSLDD